MNDPTWKCKRELSKPTQCGLVVTVGTSGELYTVFVMPEYSRSNAAFNRGLQSYITHICNFVKTKTI